ncbi:MAG TPA: helix-turn-helix domain-containing protein [Burkholderiales bacterium]|nr:helix-turn-helix domain-containing protein [Burkholderiales bacterium]
MPALDALTELATARRRVANGARLFNDGDPSRALYGVTSGFFKTVVLEPGGGEQVTGFSIPGDLLGLEGLGSPRHRVSAVALERGEVLVIPLASIEARVRADARLQRLIHAALARDIAIKQHLLLALGAMRAEERLAAFLLDLSARYRRRGYPASELRLPMTRADIGHHLGMTLETVSRLLTRFERLGAIALGRRRLTLLDGPALVRLTRGAER